MCVTNSMIPSWHFVLSQSQLISINHAFSASAFSFLFAFIVNQKPSFYSYLFVDRYIGLRKPMRWSVTFNPQLGIPALGLLVSTASMNVDLHVARPRSATNRWVAIFLGYRKFVFCFSLFFSPSSTSLMSGSQDFIFCCCLRLFLLTFVYLFLWFIRVLSKDLIGTTVLVAKFSFSVLSYDSVVSFIKSVILSNHHMLFSSLSQKKQC